MKEGDLKVQGQEELPFRKIKWQLTEAGLYRHSGEILKMSKELIDLSNFHGVAESFLCCVTV